MDKCRRYDGPSFHEAIPMILAKAEPKKWKPPIVTKKMMDDAKIDCPCDKCKPTPELPEIERFSAFEIEDMEDGVDEAIARKINELVERVNQLSK